MIIGYCRISKGDNQDAQLNALHEAGVEKIYKDMASGNRWDRPQLQKMLEFIREGDILVVWKLDRLSRSLKDLLFIMEKIEKAGAKFKSLTEAIDTTTPGGRMMMQMLGSVAEFEREMIRERTKAGLDAARKEGRIGGRRPKLTQAQRGEVIESIESGRKSQADMARLFDVSEATISRVVAQARQERKTANETQKD